MEVIKNIFPQFASSKWGEINLNELATDVTPLLLPLMAESRNPFLDANYCDQWKEFIHKLKGIDYSWGGYLEDRSVVWAGHYHDKGSVIHVGVDYYVPADTVVHCPVEAKLVYSGVDPDQNGGWGGRMIFERNGGGHVMLAHLKRIGGEIGRVYKKGEACALVAEADCNGNWSPHLHVQRVEGKTLEEVLKVDGYVGGYEGIEKDYPDPARMC